ncbi:MAG: lysoplasmalogenase [Anaerolineae bacterium]|nr:lysoplasmalogenase [Anaerolineae bacterium]
MTTSAFDWKKSLTRTKTVAIVGIVAALVFIFGGRAVDSDAVRMIAKPIPVLCLALWAYWLPQKSSYRIWLIAGLILCMFGDILLEASRVWDNDSYFLFGLVSFLLGHVAYIVMFTRDSRKLFPVRAILAYGYGILIYASLYTQGDLGDMTFPVVFYVLVIMTMVWRAASRVGVAGIGRFSAQIGLIGALLFAFSDSVLAINRFAVDLPLSVYIVIITYWLGQTGIAMSARRDI